VNPVTHRAMDLGWGSGRRRRREGEEMKAWPKHPVVYEINTWVWLTGLAQKTGAPLDLSSVPSDEWDAIAACGFDAV